MQRRPVLAGSLRAALRFKGDCHDVLARGDLGAEWELMSISVSLADLKRLERRVNVLGSWALAIDG